MNKNPSLAVLRSMDETLTRHVALGGYQSVQTFQDIANTLFLLSQYVLPDREMQKVRMASGWMAMDRPEVAGPLLLEALQALGSRSFE
ncbi:hypothetical protein [Caballeronia humi]|uniref:hypothetical protein n=1 Tax=Caballeronia humi TaxID=326474 RepID=UPI000AE2AA05|nr:hypothetical protein [Caballeronia humi]